MTCCAPGPPPRARDLRPGMRRHLRGVARGGRSPMLLSGLWDDGTTAAQLPVHTDKTNEIPVFATSWTRSRRKTSRTRSSAPTRCKRSAST